MRDAHLEVAYAVFICMYVEATLWIWEDAAGEGEIKTDGDTVRRTRTGPEEDAKKCDFQAVTPDF